MNPYIQVKGARVNNLKNVSLDIPRDQLVVVTGLSGSGKSSLAFDTLYAEGQRRYVESLSAYARQFLGRMHKPECDAIKGLPPAIAIEQKTVGRNPRSTVGTQTEIYDYLRLLFARCGHTFSPVSGQEVRRHTPEDVLHAVQQYAPGTRISILSPFVQRHGRSVREQLEASLAQGIQRLDVCGQMADIEEVLQNGNEPEAGTFYLVVDRMSVGDDKAFVSRFIDSVETAFFEGGGSCAVRIYPAGILHQFSTRFEADGITFMQPSDQLFSFNSPLGACPTCGGFGRTVGIDEHLVVPDTSLSVYGGAVVCWRGEKMNEWRLEFCRRAGQRGFPIHTPYYQLTPKQRADLWHGDVAEKALPPEEQVSIDAFFRMLQANQYKIQYRVMLARYRGKTICPDCQGSRLRPEAGYVRVADRTITELVDLPVERLKQFFDDIQLPEADSRVAERPLAEIRSRLGFLCDVGLGYLTLSRPANTLSGGESQRINLATSLGSSLVGSLYILDEPSIGLHSRDTDRLISVLRRLQQLGNTVIVVEHDEDIIRAADYLIDLGPEAGRLGGSLMYAGSLSHISRGTRSHTLQFLLGEDRIDVPATRRVWNRYIEVRGARENNLRGIDVRFPLNVMTVVTGVSGSGKSTLVRNIFYRALKRHFDEVCERPGQHSALEGDLDAISGVEFVDQNPIGKSSRSNPVTYVKAYDEIRRLMAAQPLARQMGYTAAYFSFNTPGGRCEECKGEGTVKVEMQFMADLILECESCHGKRFKPDLLEVRFQGKNVYDMLEMTVDQAIDFFRLHDQTAVVRRLLPLQQVGLGYIKLGQPSSTLSGGENQRVKLAYYLGQEKARSTLFIFDEPTTGLHWYDIKTLLRSFNALVERGHTVIIIEHNLEVIKCADHVIDLGPEGGAGGGRIVAEGTPEQVVAAGQGYTARYLAPKLQP